MPTTDAVSSPAPESVPDAVPEPPPRDWWVMIGMTIAAASAAVASFSGLYGLAAMAGWPVRLAWLLPLTLDAHAMTSARVWLAASTRSQAARRFARANALGAIAASITGNAAYHAIGTGLLDVTWPIVVLVGAVPAAVLGLTAHLHALRNRTDPVTPSRDGTGDNTADREAESSKKPKRRSTGNRHRARYRTADDLYAAARAADARYRQIHGRPITRDALRTELRISTPRASELRRRLLDPDRTEPDDADKT
ncbi:hypothetical protein Arub01_22290 [Actinomadura rubrobrunea]|uniref:DUF2637 domain-containing protein n=1 Tax=Actinomadura rubrobrunea TaxID=115335 RepID=A0A9W6PT39_9ACTN|nr:DUF2637 domain-containing protein [Actinomadura rubrobrunea]GLW63985.1 hypothetical protein Arub01_22290 [Actinomadura rubrobrunea]